MGSVIEALRLQNWYLSVLYEIDDGTKWNRVQSLVNRCVDSVPLGLKNNNKARKTQMAFDGTPNLSDTFDKELATYCVLRSRLDRDDLVEEEVACTYRFVHRAAVERDCATTIYSCHSGMPDDNFFYSFFNTIYNMLDCIL